MNKMLVKSTGDIDVYETAHWPLETYFEYCQEHWTVRCHTRMMDGFHITRDITHLAHVDVVTS